MPASYERYAGKEIIPQLGMFIQMALSEEITKWKEREEGKRQQRARSKPAACSTLAMLCWCPGSLGRSGEALPVLQDRGFGVAPLQVMVVASAEFPSLDESLGDGCPPGISAVMESATVTTGTNSSS